MTFEPKPITLKDNTQAILRSPRLEDASALLDYLTVTAGETDFLLQYPEERGAMTIEQEERFIQSMIDSPVNIMILCEVDGRIAGNCQLSMNTRLKTRHRGRLAIALYKEFWGRGIGTAMFKELIELGSSFGLSQLELEFVEGNERGRALYEKMGFEIVGSIPDAYKLKDSTLLSEIIMVKKLR